MNCFNCKTLITEDLVISNNHRAKHPKSYKPICQSHEDEQHHVYHYGCFREWFD